MTQLLTTIRPGTAVDLTAISSDPPAEITKHAAAAQFDALAEELGALQELLYAADTHCVLIVLQGMDTSGKDGTIRNVLKDVNPAGCRVSSFKVPNSVERGHDFLWRIHDRAPRRGRLVVFNRSHYEDVLVVRVKNLVPEPVWRARYDHINAFERMLTDANTIVLKFFLHISSDEQAERLMAREKDVEKAWKLSSNDWVERKAWDLYMEAYAEALSRCSTDVAPWHVVPANKKWYRNLAVTQTIVEALRPLRQGWLDALEERGRVELAAIQASRGSKPSEA